MVPSLTMVSLTHESAQPPQPPLHRLNPGPWHQRNPILTNNYTERGRQLMTRPTKRFDRMFSHLSFDLIMGCKREQSNGAIHAFGMEKKLLLFLVVQLGMDTNTGKQGNRSFECDSLSTLLRSLSVARSTYLSWGST